MPLSSSFFPGRARWRVLGAAFALGLAVSLLAHTEGALAADAPAVGAAPAPAGNAPMPGPATPATKAAPATPATAAPPAATPSPGGAPGARPPDAETPDADEDTGSDDAKGDVTIGNHGIVIQKGSKRIRVEGLGRDREYDSFEQFIQDAPWLAGLVFLTVLLVFLVPLLIIVLLIWYKMRKNRLANETMLKLAERGVVPPAAAMDAVASGTAAAVAASATPASMPAYEQARLLQRRAVWSDLRKGVILTAVGLGLSFFSIIDDGTPNSVGLILLFVGLGYCVLWFFEDRTAASRRDAPGAPPGGGA